MPSVSWMSNVQTSIKSFLVKVTKQQCGAPCEMTFESWRPPIHSKPKVWWRKRKSDGQTLRIITSPRATTRTTDKFNYKYDDWNQSISLKIFLIPLSSLIPLHWHFFLFSFTFCFTYTIWRYKKISVFCGSALLVWESSRRASSSSSVYPIRSNSYYTHIHSLVTEYSYFPK